MRWENQPCSESSPSGGHPSPLWGGRQTPFLLSQRGTVGVGDASFDGSCGLNSCILLHFDRNSKWMRCLSSRWRRTSTGQTTNRGRRRCCRRTHCGATSRETGSTMTAKRKKELLERRERVTDKPGQTVDTRRGMRTDSGRWTGTRSGR